MELISIKNSNKLNNKKYQVIGVIGEWKAHHNGVMKLTLDIFNEIIKNYEKSKVAIACDYDHALLSNNSAKASGWVELSSDALKIEDDKLLANICWTDNAKEQIKAKEYRYLSPVFDPKTIDSYSGVEQGWSLHSIALTNKPFIEELGEVMANSKEITNLENKNKELIEENETLKNEIEVLRESFINDEIENAISQKLFSNNQKSSLLKIGKKDTNLLKELITNAKPVEKELVNNMYVNSVYKKNDNIHKLSKEEMEA